MESWQVTAGADDAADASESAIERIEAELGANADDVHAFVHRERGRVHVELTLQAEGSDAASLRAAELLREGMLPMQGGGSWHILSVGPG